MAATVPFEVQVADIIAHDTVLEIEIPETDAYLVAITWGRTGMSVITRVEQPFGFTNLFFLDLDVTPFWECPEPMIW